MVIEFNDNSLKGKIGRAKLKVEEGAKKTWIWVKENPDRALGLVIGAITLIDIASKGVISVGREARRLHDIKIENRKIWDPVNGIYWYTKKPLSGAQKLEFERLVKKGYDRGQILDTMGVLKK